MNKRKKLIIFLAAVSGAIIAAYLGFCVIVGLAYGSEDERGYYE